MRRLRVGRCRGYSAPMTPLLLALSAAASPPPLSESRSEPVAQLDVLSINVWGLAWPISRNRGPRMRQLDTLDLETYDVVGMQEVWRGAWRRIPWRHRIRLPETRADSGLGLTGRLSQGAGPLTLVPFEATAGVERLKGKGILISTVEVAEIGPVWVYVTHFQAGPDAGAVRAAQAGELLALLEDRPGPAVVLGDFNLYRDHPQDADTEARLASAGLQDVALLSGSPEATYIAENPYIWRGEDGERFDRIYLRSSEEVQLELAEASVLMYDEPLSDHQPLAARIRLRRGVR
jgi:endonuclease/exonuclease/phosphatase family metal-dependent hydrolase